MKKKMVAIMVVLVVVMAAALLVACGEVKLNLDAPTGLKYDVDAGTISWNAVTNANGYTVKINDGEAYPVSGTVFPYRATTESFTVTVAATSTLSDYLPSETAVITFVAMPSVTNLAINERGVVTWDAVDGATAYAIAIDGKTQPELAYEASYNLMPVGDHTIKVRPTVSGSDSYFAKWSETKSGKWLAQVSKDSITYTEGNIQWQSVSAAKYLVTINGEAQEVSATKVAYDSRNSNFSVTVQAIGDHVVSFDGAESEQKNFVYLDTVTQIRVDDGILTWEDVPNADGYKLRINGTTLQQVFTECSYDKLVADQNVRVEIMPINNNNAYFSNWSAERNITLLKAPVLQWNDSIDLDGEAKNSVYWDGVANAAGYTVKVVAPSGKETIDAFGESERSYANAYLEVGEYKVYVKSTAATESSNVYDSVYSQPIMVRRLAAPKQPEKNFIVSDAASLQEGFTVTFSNIPNATGYRLWRDGTALQTAQVNQFKVGDLVKEGETTEQTYNYQIQSLGGINRVSGLIYATLNSLTENSLACKVTVLAVPANIDISGYTYSFGTVAKNNGYTVDVGGDKRVTSETTCDLSFLNAGNYAVKVSARGNGADILPSTYTEAINVERLTPPTDIRILTTDAAEGQLAYSGDNRATSYSAVFDNNGVEIPVDEIDNVQGMITTKGTTLYLISNANLFNSAHTVYWMTSRPSETKTFIKLATPKFGSPAFSNTQLLWNAPDNMNTRVYTPTYEVFNAADELYNGDKNGTTMDISYLAAGEYTFKVKAVGDGSNYINSDVTEPVTITKLATPNVQLATNDEGFGVYQWKAVVDATQYNITVDGENMGTYQHEAGKTYSYLPKFGSTKTYTVKVTAIGDNGYTTINSDPYVKEQQVKQLAEPEFAISYQYPDGYRDDGNIEVDITRESPYAVGYNYTVGSASAESVMGDTKTHYDKCPSSVGTYQVSVYAIGGGYDEDGVFYIDSQRHGGNSSYEIKLLAEPNASSIKVSQDGKVSWATIQGTNRYAITITVDGAEYLAKTIVTATSYVVENYADEVQGHHYEITVQALGNGTDTISSKETTQKWN